jgi:hypothetical protein
MTSRTHGGWLGLAYKDGIDEGLLAIPFLRHVCTEHQVVPLDGLQMLNLMRKKFDGEAEAKRGLERGW